MVLQILCNGSNMDVTPFFGCPAAVEQPCSLPGDLLATGLLVSSVGLDLGDNCNAVKGN
jgi:hypothetical protein